MTQGPVRKPNNSRDLLVEYLNFIFFEDYKNLYTVHYSDDYGYYILANCGIKTKSLLLPGLTARISESRKYEDSRSIIYVMKKKYELHGPGSLVIAGCSKHAGCRFPSFLKYCIVNVGNESKNKKTANTSTFLNFILLNKSGIKKGKIIRCHYGKDYFEEGDNPVCENRACIVNE